jgi:HAD superfamily hydrolase (TIGR01509 family)
MIRALVFDFDGLILDTETPAIETWEMMHAEAGLTFTRDAARDIVGHVDLPFDPWTAFDAAVDRAELQRAYRRRVRERLEKQVVLGGVLDYLNEARTRGLHTAIASNSPHSWIDSHIGRLGLISFFDVIKCRDDVERGKPEPDVYEAVLKAFRIRGGEAIAFEDSAPGSLAAKRAGLWCVAVPNASTSHHSFGHVDLTVKSLADEPLDGLLKRFDRRATPPGSAGILPAS